MRSLPLALPLLGSVLLASTASAAYLLEVDVDGLDDGVLTFNSGFSFGGDTTSASQSIPSTAFGMTGGDSIFGGNGSAQFDTYVYTYSPDSQPDNLITTPQTDLGEGNTASGRTGGGKGSYDVYATWPFTTGVSGGLTSYNISTAGDSFSVQIDQNNRGHVWVSLGSISYDNGPITVTQTAGGNTFVSMRSAGILFERTIPEPTSLVLATLAALGVISSTCRRNPKLAN